MLKLVKYLLFIVLLAITDFLDTLEQSFYIGLSIRPFRQIFFVIVIPLYVLFVFCSFKKRYIIPIIMMSIGVWNIVYGVLLPNPIEGVYYWLDPIFITPQIHWISSVILLVFGMILYFSFYHKTQQTA